MRKALQRLLSVLLVSVVLFVAVPIGVDAAVYDQDGNQLFYFFHYEQTETGSTRNLEMRLFETQPRQLKGVNVSVPVTGNYRVYLDFYRGPFLTYYFNWDSSVRIMKGTCPFYYDSDSSEKVGGYYVTDPVDIDGYSLSVPVTVHLEAGLPYWVTFYGLSVRMGGSGPYTYGADVYLQLIDTAGKVDTTHFTHGGTTRGGGVEREYRSVKVKDKDGNPLESPPPESLPSSLWILNEENKTVNLVTNEGDKSYTYNNYTYNTDTGETTVYTTTNEIIKITSYEEYVDVNYTDNSGNTIIYNYYYAPENPEGPGGGGGTSSEPEDPGGGDGGFSWDWLWNLLKGVGSFLLGLIGTLGSLLGDALQAVLGLFDFIKGLVGFLGGAFVFIPTEIWTLIGAGITVSIVLRIIKR